MKNETNPFIINLLYYMNQYILPNCNYLILFLEYHTVILVPFFLYQTLFICSHKIWKLKYITTAVFFYRQ